MVRVELPEPPVMVVGLSDAVMPVEALAVRATLPVNPLMGVTVIVDVPELPATNMTFAGLAERLKSGLVTMTVITAVVCVSEPLVPVTVTV